ncbi:beta-alanine-activating enzyme isoform X2 [Conger conger]|uniref:beta-alanine-activating enzyme isoform X2 n=1 Tax=Conger conger TaxID=82655 RepID=UPI002A5995EA|nr:beta-alanine-activating enzyme isoform X2 [Conger conger]
MRCGTKRSDTGKHLIQRFHTAFSPHLPVEVCAVWHSQGLTLVKVQPNNERQTERQDEGRSQTEWQDEGRSQTERQDEGRSQTEWQDEGRSQTERQDEGRSQTERQDEGSSVRCKKDLQGQQGERPWLSPASLGSLAYVLHTSGTTGLPKTVRVPHHCIVPNILHLRSLFQVTAEDVVFMASPLTFDPSVVEMFLSLSSGACLLIVPTVIKKVPDRLVQVLFKRHRITVLQATPTLLGRFGGRALRRVVLSAASPLRVLALGGEACPPLSVLRSWRGEGNSTQFFNLYGTTEVSCWATCHQLHLDNLSGEAVPLGSALMGTAVEVRDEDGQVVTQGEGQLFIGGRDRVCFLGDEVAVAQGTMRSTGDWVEVKDAHLYYLGRRDRLVKRHGQRLHLDGLQQVLQSLPQVEVCAVALWEGQSLVAFVVPSSSESPAPSTGELQRGILGELSQLLPSYNIPESIILLPGLPLTSHGKVNMAALLQVYEKQRAVPMSHDALGDRDTLTDHLQRLWREALSLSDDALVAMDSHFLLSGGDSLRSLRLCDDIIASVGGAQPGLLEVILSRSFADLLSHVATAMLPQAKRKPQDPLPPTHTKRKQPDSLSPPNEKSFKQPDSLSPPSEKSFKQPDSLSPPSEKSFNQPDSLSPSCKKRLKQQDGLSPPCQNRLVRWTVVRRGGEVRELLSQEHNPPLNTANERADHTHSHTAGPNERADHPHSHTARPNERADHPHSHTAGPNERADHPHSHTARPNERADHPHSHTARPNERADHPHSHTAGPNERADHPHSHTAGPNERADHPHSHTAGPNERADHTHSHTAGPNERADHTHSHTAGPNERADHTHSHTAGPNERADHTHSHTAGPNERADHTHSHTAGPNERADHTHSHTAGPNERADHTHSHTAGPNERADHTHSHTAGPNERADHTHSHTAGPNERADHTHSHTAGPNERADHTHSHTAGPNERADHTHSHTAGPNERADHTHSHTAGPNERAADGRPGGATLAMRVRWRSDTGRCVDASPVLLVSQWGGGVAYVGSHSHRLQAVALAGGQLLWERVLGGRLEAAAAITRCGSLIAIGCYDWQVYFLSRETGQTCWVFGTRDVVKSSPAVDMLTGLVLVGSHDGHIYALDPEAQRCVWSRSCGGGAIFSSPCLHPSLRQLYVATLRGELLCLNPESGALLWKHSSAAPFFSSPCCSGTTLCIGSVDHNIHGFSHRGDLLWRFPTDGPVFSSPCGMPASLANQNVFCGSHDGSVYCLRLCDGALVWRFRAGAKVYSSPFLFHSEGGALVAVATTDGKLWILGAEDGTPRASLSLPGEIFSSPVLWERILVVGCRNDFVYGIELTSS